ncbi:hypothetical protein Dred_2585 [Desulforamulus reducens MI-1]|uniref:Uncharacterized protein n=1 Tax=Desulforamulus reducens (strain ATCC BAA-1160 / DSM 100696 / MI-1) TaxID=349161 RepID=A4J7P2_DESRM|nr:hypothetical protein [Desulforamulus reducens]ABO51095.1 hypothetical protein Dred_2585 [Desulforamulus reducens MI-1]
MIFSADDPFERSIILKNGTWEYKILPNHPEVKPYLIQLKNLIENPYYIVKDMVQMDKEQKAVHPTREEYIDVIPNKSTGFVMIKAIVDHNTNPSEIVTALISSKVRGLTSEGGFVYVRSEETDDKKKTE